MDFNEAKFLERRGITLYLDVGANTGQTGSRLRGLGWKGAICSFEPLPDCFDLLAARAKADPHWTARNLAVGSVAGTVLMGRSENRVSSSIREATEQLIQIHNPVRYVDRVQVQVVRLDAVLDEIASTEDVIHLKIDTQGFERDVILGADAVLDRIDTVRMEVAVSEVYVGEMVIPEAITLMTERGFVLIEAWPAWRHPASGEVLHFDLLFRRGKISV
jgi:FkbM family methyltransferase